MTTPISSTSFGAQPAQTKPTDDSTGGKDMFMKLLVAQLRYQNPMSPTDGNQYMTQMATFTQVEKLGQLVEAQAKQQQWTERLAAEALIGKQVTGMAADHTAHTGVVTAAQMDGTTPTLTLADGSTIAVGDVSHVEQVS